MTRTGTQILGLICVVFALFCVAVWIPFDTDTGLIEKVRRRVQIGDALAPTVAAAFVLLGGLVLLLSPGRPVHEGPQIRALLRFAIGMIGIVVSGFAVMLYAGPVAVAIANLFQADPLEYRLLRGSYPWKYLGFVLGGTWAIGGVICLAERRVTVRAMAVGVIAVLAMIVLFDLPFDDLLLPPNGDY